MAIKVSIRQGEITVVSQGRKRLKKYKWAHVKGPVVAMHPFSLVRFKEHDKDFQFGLHWWWCWLWKCPYDPFDVYFNADGMIEYIESKQFKVTNYAVDLNQNELQGVTLSVIRPCGLVNVAYGAKTTRWHVFDRHGSVWM